ncbi:Sec-independent protein translocase protein TatB [Sphingomonas sp. HITSZ_GF]|uniref:Sec-independent protein translocase protein TatB n=1 Tax=Sphingomonas sp. HITSZ_GF TaxID=3037247 RepID=UPI00240D9440|nr:Sec-independent protein translocase protein TatB [Sphingomonas sp. HITSZ_GF]MDG2535981.1 Sec-independent protein translocase protein TatB [Sphingomonas sp. HITSZ_GF]
MLDFNAPEFVVVAIVALLVIGPKDLPKAMRFVGKWFGKARAVARQFRSGFDTMVREAELAELEKQWAAENARIMSEHPPAALPAPETEPLDADVHLVTEEAAPVMVAQPEIVGETPGVSAPKPKRARKAPAKAEAVAEPVAKAPPKPRARKAAAAPAEPAAPKPASKPRAPRKPKAEAAE